MDMWMPSAFLTIGYLYGTDYTIKIIHKALGLMISPFGVSESLSQFLLCPP